jgi:4-methyl-5(b-hydroxyethyl)-thiazole monophosphate biosynthesis
MKHPSALVLIFDGVEEVEAVTPIDLLRRAGVTVTVAATGKDPGVTGRNQIRLTADMILDDIREDDFDLLVLPGGPGCIALMENHRVMELIKTRDEKHQPLAAICAAPMLLAEAGALRKHAYTAHHSVAEKLPRIVDETEVVQDGHIITSRGAGTAIAFGLSLVAGLAGEEKAREVAESICYRGEPRFAPVA